jgi:hypothetical protein
MLTQQEFTTLKSRLTRAKKSGDADRVLYEVKDAVRTFNEKGWPDNWPMWRVAAEDVLPIFDPRLAEIEELFL